jgi:hypothetical protein
LFGIFGSSVESPYIIRRQLYLQLDKNNYMYCMNSQDEKIMYTIITCIIYAPVIKESFPMHGSSPTTFQGALKYLVYYTIRKKKVCNFILVREEGDAWLFSVSIQQQQGL